MSAVFVSGLGVVSPAGWGVAALREALRGNQPLPVQPLPRPGGAQPLSTRPVPPPPSRLPFLAHPRLRRTSPITQHAAGAALEALAGARANGSPGRRLGLITCSQCGCVQYSCRFLEETLKDPATASPLVFPETVYAAPVSHLAALLGDTPLATSLVGDPGCFLQGLALAADWLIDNRVDCCLVIGAEENHWVLAEALRQFDHAAVLGSGAGAICLTLDPSLSMGVRLEAITDSHTFSSETDRARAALGMRAQFLPNAPGELLCDGLGVGPRTDAPERRAWDDWTGPRLSPKRILGEGLMAASAWQCVAACDAVAQGQAAAATVSLVGCNQQAIGARFVSHHL